jgi:hypothetical protein
LTSKMQWINCWEKKKLGNSRHPDFKRDFQGKFS